jgi:hypothetical protein
MLVVGAVVVTVLAFGVAPLQALAAPRCNPLVVVSLGACVCWSYRLVVLGVVRCFFSWSSLFSIVAAHITCVALFSRTKLLLRFGLCL